MILPFKKRFKYACKAFWQIIKGRKFFYSDGETFAHQLLDANDSINLCGTINKIAYDANKKEFIKRSTNTN